MRANGTNEHGADETSEPGAADPTGHGTGAISRRRFGALTAVGAVGMVGGLTGAARAPQCERAGTAPAAILTRSGTSLLVSGRSARLSGMNAYWVGLNDNVRNADGAPTFPTHQTLTDAFDGMRSMGASLVRAHTVGMSAGTPRSFETAPGQFSHANLDSADWAVYQARLNGIVLMVPVVDQWNYYHGGKGVFVHWAYQQNSSGLTDVPAPEHLFDADGAEKGSKIEDQFFASTAGGLRIRTLFTRYLTQLMAHVNPYTGLSYGDDPTIAILETGNEIYPATSEWTQAIARHLKSIAPRKLIADGSAATGLAVSTAPGRDVSEIDILGAHYYAQDSSYQPAPIMTLAGQLDADVAAAGAAGKAFVLGEYPWTRSDIGQWWSKVEGTKQIAADLMWTYVAGQQTHGGSFGSDDFSVHQPYANDQERTYGPALVRHTRALSGVSASAARRRHPKR